MDEARETIQHVDDYFEHPGGSYPLESEIGAVARSSRLENAVDFVLVSLTSSSTNFNYSERIEPRSDLEDLNISREHQSRHLGRKRLTSMFDPGSITPGCTHQRSDSTSSCAVVGSSFCLGDLSMVSRCTLFGGGPGIDRDGEQVSGKFCGVGARYRVAKNTKKPNLKKSPGTVGQAFPGNESNLGKSVTVVEDKIFTTEAETQKMIYSLVSLGLNNKTCALEIAKTLLLPRVPGLAEKVKNTLTEFEDNVKEVTDSEFLIENVSLFKKSKVKVLLELDLGEFLDLLGLPDKEASTSLLNTLKEWNDAVKNFLAIFLPNSKRRGHKNQ